MSSQNSRLVEGRLERWFATEVRRAERDLRTRPVRPAANGARLHILRLIVAIATAMAGVIGITAVAFAPTITFPGRELPPGASGDTSSLPPGWTLGRVPRTIGTEQVRSPEDAARQLASMTDDRPILVGGWLQAEPPMSCPSPLTPVLTHRLAPACDLGVDLAARPDGAPGLRGLVTEPGVHATAGSPIVLRVHTHDGGASECPAELHERCDRAVVIDGVVWGWPADLASYPDGIPNSLGGEPVLRAAEAARSLPGPVHGPTVLVGGWLDPGRTCTDTFARNGPTSWCQVTIGEPASSGSGDSLSLRAEGPGDTLPSAGPVVVRVRPEKGEIVVDRVEWTGSSRTFSAPLTIADVAYRLRALPAGIGPLAVIPPSPSGECAPPYPAQTWQQESRRGYGPTRAPIGHILVYPNQIDRARAEQSAVSGRFMDESAYGPCDVVVQAIGRWVSQDNVMVQVLDPALADEVSAALAQP